MHSADDEWVEPHHHITRRLTSPEQALAARLGWQETTREDDDKASAFPLIPTAETVLLDTISKYKLPKDEPSAYVVALDD